MPFAHGMGLISDELFEVGQVIYHWTGQPSSSSKLLKTHSWCALGRITVKYYYFFYFFFLGLLRFDFRFPNYLKSIILQEVQTECGGNFYNPMSENCESRLNKVDSVIYLYANDDSKCFSLLLFLTFMLKYFPKFQDIAGLNIYDILEPCYHDSLGLENPTVNSRLPSSFRQLGETDRPLRVRTRLFGRAWPLRAPVREGIVPTWPQLLSSGNVPCTVSFLTQK